MYHSYTYGTIHHERNEVLWRKDGTAFYVSYTSTGVAKEGQLVGSIVTFMDITEEREAEESLKTARREAEERSSQLQKVNLKLRESDEIFQSITSAALNAIIMIDNDGKVIFWNRAAEGIFGWEREEIEGKNLHELLVTPEYYNSHMKAFSHFQKTGQGAVMGKTVGLTSIRKNGDPFIIV